LKLLTAMSTAPTEDEKPSPAFEFMVGNAHYAAGQYEGAEAKYRSAVEQNPAFMRAWNNLGILYHVQDRHADAVKSFSKSVSLGDREPTTLGLLGNSLEKTGNRVLAEMVYRQALAADPENINWTEGMLRIYLDEKQYPRAESLVRALVKSHPQESRYWLTYANLLISSDRKIEATALLERMQTMNLAHEQEMGLLADLYADQGMTPEVLVLCRRIGASDPLRAEQKLRQFARTLIADRSWTEVSKVLEVLTQLPLSPAGTVDRHKLCVEMELGRKNWIGARRELEILLNVAPGDGDAWIGLGRLCLAEAEPSQAIEAFERAYAIPESSYRASLELTNIEFKNRHYERCLTYLDHALSLQRSAAVENFRKHIRTLIPPENLSTP
jgi:tetratricopeptide (TPR) repeat protein